MEVLQLLIEQQQALLRHFIRLEVIDADLQEVEPRGVQLFNPLGDQEVAVRDQAGHHPAAADPADQDIEVRVQHGLAAAERDHGRAEIGELVDPIEHRRGWNRRRNLVVLVAVAAVDVAAADRDDLYEQRVGGMGEPAGELPQGARFTADTAEGQA